MFVNTCMQLVSMYNCLLKVNSKFFAVIENDVMLCMKSIAMASQ